MLIPRIVLCYILDIGSHDFFLIYNILKNGFKLTECWLYLIIMLLNFGLEKCGCLIASLIWVIVLIYQDATGTLDH